jgi:hypothetical protein
LFGSFIEEDAKEVIVYGTRGPLRSWNPVWANLHGYAGMARDAWHTAHWADKLRVWFKHPGWRPADVQQRFPKPVFDIRLVQRYDPPMSPGAAGSAVGLFVVLLGATSLLLWHAHRMSLPQQLLAAAGVVAGLWAVGWVSERPTRGGMTSGS